MAFGDDYRYSRLTDIMKIIVMLLNNLKGLTVEQVAREIEACNRTAQRVLTAIHREVSGIGDYYDPDTKEKRWGIRNEEGQRQFFKGLIGFSKGEIEELKNIKKILQDNNMPTEKIDTITSKIQALMSEDN